MNERIRQLAEQLGPVGTIGNWGRVRWSDDIYPQHGDKMYADIDLEKFAELIVRECAEVVSNQYSEDWGKWSNRMILEHFGDNI
jgi:hypothetical protein